ncbi:MAG TPA: pilus assembly protein PilM [Tepidisphaeraceae bacterium]|jgi:type IV pilus assembly protein PilM|nr:pilus assembly protein PilM [Tepidisphaeraceae bacterium]
MLSFVQNFFAPKANPIGVDFGSDTLRLAQVQKISSDSSTGTDEYKLIAAASADVPSHIRKDTAQRFQFFVETSRDLLAQGNFRGRQAILSLPIASMFIQHLRIAKMSEEELKKALPWEARGQLPIDPSHALLRHIVAGEIFQEQEPKNEVILLAAAKSFVEQLLNSAAKAKLDVIGMNVEPKALIDCFTAIYRRKIDAEATSMFVEIGTGSTRAIIAQARQIYFARSIPVGGDQFNQAAAAALHTSFDDAKMLRMQLCCAAPTLDDTREKTTVDTGESQESSDNSFALLSSAAESKSESATATLEPATTKTTDPQQQSKLIEQSIREPLNRLVEELNLCRRYHESTFPNKPVDRLIFVGGEARQRTLCSHIAREMGLAAQVGDPLVRMGRISDVGIESGIDRRQPQPNWAVAIGLSIGPGNAPEAK